MDKNSPQQLARRTIGLVLAGGRGSRLKALTDRRTKPAVYFGGKFRIIDFALSNCLNSGVRRIGVLTQFIDSPFYGEALRGIEDELYRAQYAPLFVSGHWNEVEESSRIALLQERKVDGLIVLTGRLSDQTLIDVASALPVVVTGRRLSAPNLFSIDFDNDEGAKLAVQHLHAMGHRQMAFISGPLDHPDAVQRLNGFRQEL